MRNWNRFQSDRITTDAIIRGYSDMVQEYLDAGWHGYLLTFMFDDLGGPPKAVKSFMSKEVEWVYKRHVSRVVRKPRAVSQARKLPVWILCPDYPVPKKSKNSVSDVALNDGLHIGGIALLPPVSRLDTGLDTHFASNADTYTRLGTNLRRIGAKPILETPRRAVDYSFKALRRGRVTYDDILLLPVSPDELPEKPMRR